MGRQTYEITASNGAVYQIETDSEEQATALANAIEAQIQQGNPSLDGAELPYEAEVEHFGPQEDTSTVGATLRGLVSGGVPWDDEIISLGNAAGLAGLDNMLGATDGQQSFMDNPEGFWAAFRHNLDENRALKAADEEQHPTARFVGQLGGALASGSAALKGGSLALQGAARVAPRAVIPATAAYEASALARPGLTAAASGSAAGAATGALYGSGEGDTAESRWKSGALGAIGGATLGMGVSAAHTVLGPTIARYWNALRGKVPEEEAVQQIVRKLHEDGYDVASPAGVKALKDELARYTGKPVSLADIGNATRARAGVGLRQPSEVLDQSVEQVLSRARGQVGRLQSDITDTVAPRTDVYALDDALVEQRAQAAEQLKEQALFERKVIPPEIPNEAPPPYVESPTAGLERIVAPPVEASAAAVKPFDRNFVEQMQARVEPEVQAAVPAAPPQPFGPPAPTIIPRSPRMVEDPVLNDLISQHPMSQRALAGAVRLSQSERATRTLQGQAADDIPEMLAGQPLDFRTADYFKRYLDKQIETLARRGETDSFTMAEFNALKELRNTVRQRMRDTNDEYANYLDAYSGSSDMIDSLAAGQSFGNVPPEVIAAEQAGRSTAGQELYRVGVARSLQDTVRKTGDNSNAATRLLNNDYARDQLAATGVAPDDLLKLNNAVQQERQFNKLTAELSGSPTIARRDAERDADAALVRQLPFNPGSTLGWAGALLRNTSERIGLQRNRAVNEAIMPRLLETNPQAIDKIISDLEASGQQAAAERLRRVKISARNSALGGVFIGGAVAVPEGDY